MPDDVLDNCPNREQHTPAPDGYVAWHEWAARMYREGRRQHRCPGCERLAIWLPAPDPAWSCRSREDSTAAGARNQDGGA